MSNKKNDTIDGNSIEKKTDTDIESDHERAIISIWIECFDHKFFFVWEDLILSQFFLLILFFRNYER